MEEVFQPLLDLATKLKNQDNDQKVQMENIYNFSMLLLTTQMLSY